MIYTDTMKYRIEFQTTLKIEATEIEARDEIFARVAFYEIYSRSINILSVTKM